MHIVFISTYDAPCGISTYCENLVKELAKEHTITIFAELDPKEFYPKQTVSDTINCAKIWKRHQPYDTLQGLSAISRYLKDNNIKPDVVHIQHEFGIFSDENFFRLLEDLSAFTRNKVVTLHTVSRPPSNIGFFKKLENYVLKTIVHTAEANTVLDEGYERRAVRSECALIPHGCPINYGQNLKKLPPRINILCPGFVSPSKGHEELIDSFGQAFSNFEENTNLHIVGLCRDGNYLNRLKSQIRSYNLDSNIFIDEGFKSDREIIEYLSSVDFIVLGGGKTSPYSASGQLAQAVGSYLPVIAKDIPIYRSQTSDKILHFSNTNECAYFMQKLANSENLREKLSNHEGFPTWAEVAKKHVALYNYA